MDTTRRAPHTLVTVRFLEPARPFGRGDLVELPWRDAEALIQQKVAELVEPRAIVETR